ncbi:hypothetical protein RCL1_009029 [Eukaryota sp. TZLM3-RCL]
MSSSPDTHSLLYSRSIGITLIERRFKNAFPLELLLEYFSKTEKTFIFAQREKVPYSYLELYNPDDQDAACKKIIEKAYNIVPQLFQAEKPQLLEELQELIEKALVSGMALPTAQDLAEIFMGGDVPRIWHFASSLQTTPAFVVFKSSPTKAFMKDIQRSLNVVLKAQPSLKRIVERISMYPVGLYPREVILERTVEALKILKFRLLISVPKLVVDFLKGEYVCRLFLLESGIKVDSVAVLAEYTYEQATSYYVEALKMWTKQLESEKITPEEAKIIDYAVSMVINTGAAGLDDYTKVVASLQGKNCTAMTLASSYFASSAYYWIKVRPCFPYMLDSVFISNVKQSHQKFIDYHNKSTSQLLSSTCLDDFPLDFLNTTWTRMKYTFCNLVSVCNCKAPFEPPEMLKLMTTKATRNVFLNNLLALVLPLPEPILLQFLTIICNSVNSGDYSLFSQEVWRLFDPSIGRNQSKQLKKQKPRDGEDEDDLTDESGESSVEEQEAVFGHQFADESDDEEVEYADDF